MMNRSTATWSLLLAGAGLAACSGATYDAPRSTEQAATPPVAGAACSNSVASAPDGRKTSKTRHLPDESSACPDSRGLGSAPTTTPK